jgi:two-component SAPR family response regulator
MKLLHILIVEDEALVALDLENMIMEIVEADIVIEATIAGTKKTLLKDLDFAFLDVDVTNGKTFEIAQILEGKNVPFVFVSASAQAELPAALRSSPFISKPFFPAEIEHALEALTE